MPQYHKKPVEVEARQMPSREAFDANEPFLRALAAWCGGKRGGKFYLDIPTLEREVEAGPGDWIIKDGDGAFSVCAPHMFAARYVAA
jgi:hypothetical protein